MHKQSGALTRCGAHEPGAWRVHTAPLPTSPGVRMPSAWAYKVISLLLGQCRVGAEKVLQRPHRPACSPWCSRACSARAGHFLVWEDDPPKQWRRRSESPASTCGAQPIYPWWWTGATPTASRRGTDQRLCLGARSDPEECRVARPSPRTQRVHVGAASGDCETSRFYLMSARLRGGVTPRCNTSVRSTPRVPCARLRPACFRDASGRTFRQRKRTAFQTSKIFFLKGYSCT